MTVFHNTIQAYTRAINTLDADAFAACFAANCELNDPVGAPPARGHEGAKAFFGAFAPLLQSIRIQPGRVFLNGGQAAFTWTIEAAGNNGKSATAEGIDVFEFDESGKITRSYGYWDPKPFVAALTA
jgi:steroid delta-isomerase